MKMKKTTFIMAGVMAFASTMAQDARITGPKRPVVTAAFSKTIQAARNAQPVNAATVIFSEDFASGIPGTWTIADNAGVSEVWTHSFGPGGATVIAGDTLMSPTAADGFAIIDDDLYGDNAIPNNTDLTTPAINCTGFTTVHLNYYEYYRQFAALSELQVSNDNVTWTTIYDPTTGLGQNQASVNPKVIDIDITSVAANQATVYVRFHYEGNWDYWWQVDDVQLYEPSAADGQVVEAVTVDPSCGLTNAELVGVVIRNAGTAALSNFDASFSVNGGTPVTETVPGPINPGDTLLYVFTATADFSAVGSYTVDASIAITGDANTANDAGSTSTENITSYDLGTGAVFMGFETTDDITGWTIEDANGDGQIWAYADNVNFTVAANTGQFCLRVGSGGTDVNDWLYTKCMDLDAAKTYTLDYWVHLFSDPADLVEAFVGNDNASAAMTQSISTNTGVVSFWNQSTTNFTVASSGTYYIGFHASSLAPNILRLDDVTVSEVVGVSEVKAETKWFDVYPNPASSDLSVRMNRPFDNANVQVINALGAVVLESKITTAVTGVSISTLNSGLYTAKITVDGVDVYKRFTVSK
jgi:hypothetical protein